MSGLARKKTFPAIALTLCLSLQAFGSLALAAGEKNLTLGCLAYSEPMLQWIKEGLEPLGYFS